MASSPMISANKSILPCCFANWKASSTHFDKIKNCMAELKSPSLRKNRATNFAPSVLLVSLTSLTAASGLFRWSKWIRTALSKSLACSYATTASLNCPSASLAERDGNY